MEKKIFWISFTVLGVAADFILPIWWALERRFRLHTPVGGSPIEVNGFEAASGF